MGKKGKWFGAVKKVFSPESKEKKDQKLKKKWGFGGPKTPDPSSSDLPQSASQNEAPPPHPHSEEIKLAEVENEQSKHAYSVAVATAAAAEAAAAAAQAAAEVVRLAMPTEIPGKSREEIAAIKIQTAFRGYLARRALRALRGLVRLKSLLDGNSVKRQATNTLRCMQTLSRVQSQIRSRRLRMNEENQALHHQLLLKHERELESLRMGEEWDDSLQSKEQIEASLVNKQEAAIRRERALAYAFSHQWKSSSRSANPMFMDPNNPQWGWSWLERWMAARSWEIQTKTDKENNTDRASLKGTNQNIGEGEITRAYARRETKLDRPSPPTPTPKLNSIRPGTRKSPSTPSSRASKIKLDSPRNGLSQLEDDVKSMVSAQSERIRRQSFGGSPSIRDDESLASSPSLPSYMVPTESARAKSRLQSPSIEKIVKTPEKGSAGSVKKRLSFPAGDKHNSALPMIGRRHSGPPKVDIAAMKDIEVHSELNATNGADQ